MLALGIVLLMGISLLSIITFLYDFIEAFCLFGTLDLACTLHMTCINILQPFCEVKSTDSNRLGFMLEQLKHFLWNCQPVNHCVFVFKLDR